MAYDSPSGMRLPRIDDLPPRVTTLIMARVLTEVYSAGLNEPIPERLAVILRQIESREKRHG